MSHALTNEVITDAKISFFYQDLNPCSIVQAKWSSPDRSEQFCWSHAASNVKTADIKISFLIIGYTPLVG